MIEITSNNNLLITSTDNITVPVGTYTVQDIYNFCKISTVTEDSYKYLKFNGDIQEGTTLSNCILFHNLSVGVDSCLDCIYQNISSPIVFTNYTGTVDLTAEPILSNSFSVARAENIYSRWSGGPNNQKLIISNTAATYSDYLNLFTVKDGINITYVNNVNKKYYFKNKQTALWMYYRSSTSYYDVNTPFQPCKSLINVFITQPIELSQEFIEYGQEIKNLPQWQKSYNLFENKLGIYTWDEFITELTSELKVINSDYNIVTANNSVNIDYTIPTNEYTLSVNNLFGNTGSTLVKPYFGEDMYIVGLEDNAHTYNIVNKQQGVLMTSNDNLISVSLPEGVSILKDYEYKTSTSVEQPPVTSYLTNKVNIITKIGSYSRMIITGNVSMNNLVETFSVYIEYTEDGETKVKEIICHGKNVNFSYIFGSDIRIYTSEFADSASHGTISYNVTLDNIFDQ